jgi:hypothetical protein
MQYMVLIYADPTGWDERSEDEQNAITAEYMALRDDPRVIGGGRLEPASTSTTVQVRDGRTLTTDGPFVETKEELGGYYLVDADDIDGAIEIASKIPAARQGSGAVEVRPIGY